MKKLLILTMLIAGFAHADDSGKRAIHVYKDSDGSVLLSAREVSDSNLTHVKSTHYPLEGGAWQVSCSKDKFNGSKKCSLYKNHSNLMVNYINGKPSVYVGRNHYPRTKSAIKIDGNQTIYGYEGLSQIPQKVVEQMKKGKIAHTRYHEWPYEYNKDGEVDLTGFTEKYDEMMKQYQAL